MDSSTRSVVIHHARSSAGVVVFANFMQSVLENSTISVDLCMRDKLSASYVVCVVCVHKAIPTGESIRLNPSVSFLGNDRATVLNSLYVLSSPNNNVGIGTDGMTDGRVSISK